MSESLLSLYEAIYSPLYFSAVLTTTFYGVTCMQTFFYYVHYPNDSRRMKSFVAALWAFDTIHEALTIAGVYKYILAILVNPAAIQNDIPELNLQILSAASVTLPSQAFFVYRIYIMSGKNRVAPLLWVIQAIYQIVGAILYEAKSFYIVNGSLEVIGLSELDDSFFVGLTISGLSLAAAVDVLIAIALTYLLVRKRAITGFASSAHILQRLTIFAVNTGIWTATFALLSAILMHALPSNILYVVFAIPLSSLYCNTVLANLNARVYIRGETTTHYPDGDLMMMSSPLSSDTKAEQSRETKLTSSTHLAIGKTTEVVTFRDADWSATPENSV